MDRDWNDFKSIYSKAGARDKFEEVCVSIIQKKYPGENVQPVKANPGDMGIDFFRGEIGDQAIIVYQCKFFLEQIGESQKKQIRQSFLKAVNSKLYTVAEWVLCLPKIFDFNENMWWSDWKKKNEDRYKTKITLLHGDDIINLLKQYGLYNIFFKIDDSVRIEKIYNKIVGEKKKEFMPDNKFIDTLSIDIKNFLIEKFSNKNDFDNLCREFKINNFFSGNFDSRITSFLHYIEHHYPDAIEKLYRALLHLRPHFEKIIHTLFIKDN
ncbi:MAG: hypothetical protein JXB88_04485 [Spirochaetales bacterium]|nr:hypothetical protein [Spirochaetales bacterium]